MSLLSIILLSCSVNHILLHPVPCQNRNKNEMKRSYQTMSLKHMLNTITKSRCSSKGASQVALVVENPPANVGDIRDSGLIPGSGRSPGGGHGNPLQCSCLENPMDRGAWRATIHRVARSWTQLKQLSTHTLHACMFFKRHEKYSSGLVRVF